MSMIHAPRTPREEIYAARARKARGWAWTVRLMLVACVGVAIWQEPQIWPEAHATMQRGAETVAGMIDENDKLRGFIAGWTGERTGGGTEGYADKLASVLSR
jgi:hypothetical protein